MTAPRPALDWPALMPAPIAAAYMGEASVEAFRRRVGSVYPRPVTIDGRGQVWPRESLDKAIERMMAAATPAPKRLADDL